MNKLQEPLIKTFVKILYVAFAVAAAITLSLHIQMGGLG